MSSLKSKLRKIIRSLRNWELIWRYGFNFLSTLEYALSETRSLTRAEESILTNLNRDGVAVTSIDMLLTDTSEFDRLGVAVEGLLKAREKEIAALGSQAADLTQIGSKTFNLELLGSELRFDSADVFCCFPLISPILNIANAYMRMYALLRYYNVWYTFATATAPRESQLWHFDREDNYILKVFVYLKDVGIGTGPFTYAPGTHRKGPHWNRKPESFSECNVQRTSDEQMNAVIPQEDWITATGKRGTIVFADTRGYHKGGAARDDHRLMYTCMFTSPASDSKRLLSFPDLSTFKALSRKQRFALNDRS